MLASGPRIPKFVPEAAATCSEPRNRDTRSSPTERNAMRRRGLAALRTLLEPGVLRFVRNGVAVAALAAVMVSAEAANNSITGVKKDDGFQTAAPYAILIHAESASVPLG